jgi:hypothetical protein
VACPATTQCTAVDDSGGEVTFDPTSATPNSTPHTVDSGEDLHALACPSNTQCTAVDGSGGEVTFDPTSATPNSTAQTVDAGPGLDGVACPSATQCTAVDPSGGEVTFDPTSATPNSTPYTIDSTLLNTLDCPSATQCGAVDGFGREVTFDPTSAAPNSTPHTIVGANSLDSIACVSVGECVAVDDVGNGFTGTTGAGGTNPPGDAPSTPAPVTPSTPTPVMPSTPTTVAPPLPPVAASLSASESNRVFKIASNPKLVTTARRHRRIGTTFKYTLDEAASIRFDFTQQVQGRKVHGRCIARTNHNERKHRCTRTVTRGTLSFAGHPGANTVKFYGWLSRSRKLKPGKYTLIITATVPGARSTSRKLKFTIVR